MTKELPVIPFASAADLEQWIATNYKQSDGIWLKIAKKASGIPTITYDEALDIALCYGWIDGQLNKLDDQFYLQKFTPRRPRSTWSKRNIENVARLIAGGRMQPAGQTEIDAAKADGRWDAAYDAQSNMEIPQDFLDTLQKHPHAEAFFGTLNRTNIFAIVWRLQTAKKPETRQRRLDTIIAMLERGEKFH